MQQESSEDGRTSAASPAGAAGDTVRWPGGGAGPGAEALVSVDRTPLRRQIGRFEVVEMVGHGAFGEVYKARDPMLGRIVAVKVPRLGESSGPDVDRFLLEARSMAQLRHPGIVPVHEAGYADGVPHLVCEYVEGVTLADRLSAGPLAPAESARIVAAVADALAYAHAQGVIHRDVKPSNIMLGLDGRAMLMDFGMAKRVAADGAGKSEGELLGTPAYMSPEQARGEAQLVDGRTDVYSLGVVLYQLLSGELPFRGNARMVLHQVLHDAARPPRAFNDRIPRALEMVCMKAMDKEPDQRYPSADEMAADLRRYLDGLPVLARPVSLMGRAWLAARRPERVHDAGAIAVFLGVILILWTLYDIVYYGLVTPPARPWEAFWQRLGMIGCFFGPIALVGAWTLRRSAIAVALGVAYGAMGLAAAVLFQYQHLAGLRLEIGGTYADPQARVAIGALFSVLSSILMVVYVIAAIAYVSNRNALRWYRSADARASVAMTGA